MDASKKGDSWLVPITNEKNEVIFDNCGNIYVYNTANKTTGCMNDTIDNRLLLKIPLNEPNVSELHCEPEAETEDLTNLQYEDKTGPKWTHDVILLLLSLYEDHLQDFKSSHKTNKSIWNSIARCMLDKGHLFTGDQCDIKFRNLKKTYKRIKDNNAQSGRGTMSWPYFQKFDDIFGNSHAVQPIAIASNISGYVTSPSTSMTDMDLSSSSRSTTPTGPPEKKRRVAKTTEVEPAWLKEFRKEQAERHVEKMSIFKELIAVLKDKSE